MKKIKNPNHHILAEKCWSEGQTLKVGADLRGQHHGTNGSFSIDWMM